MKMSVRLILVAAAAGVLALAATGCSRRARAARSAARADRYYAAGQYDQAEIEYKNALQLDVNSAHVIGRLGAIYFEEGRFGPAIPFLLRARDLRPDDPDARSKLATLYLVSGRLAEARTEAALVLKSRPRDPDAPLLLAEASAKPAETAEARRMLQNLPDGAAGGAPVLVALAALDFRERRQAEGEAELARAQSVDPKSSSAWSLLGLLRWGQHDLARAKLAFQRSAELSPPRSPNRLQYATFVLQSGDHDGGKRLLDQINHDTPDYLPAWIRTAQLAAADRRYDDGLAALAHVFSRDSANPEALLLSGQLQQAKGDPAKAAAEFERMLAIYPRSAQAAYSLGTARLAAGDPAKAADAFAEALRLVPDYPDATLALAGINLRKGDYSAALIPLKNLVKLHPTIGQAWLLLADAYRGQGSLDEALNIYRHIEKDNPRDPEAALLTGLTLAAQEKTDEARRAFERALAIAPDYVPALEQLVNLDLAGQRFDAAMDRVRERIAKDPNAAGLRLLEARICIARKDTAQAEAALRKAIELRPDLPTGYLLLAQLYLETNQQDKAQANLQTAIAKNPRDVAALVLSGVIYDGQKNYAAARDAYEKTLAVDPKSGLALNNLAYLYSEHLNQPDRALELAQRARDLLPNEPHAADTLGWILFKRRQLPWALSLLHDSAEKLPTEPDVIYHLGMVQYMMGEEAAARAALERALQLSRDFPGADEARDCLSILAIDPAQTNAAEIPAIEKRLEARSGDAIALARLAQLQERAGALDKAVESWNAALKSNPSNVTALTNLARLEEKRGRLPEALEFAKTARKQAPDNPAVTHQLGRLAFRTGDHVWAASLLQEAAGRRPDDPDLLGDLADALYSTGRVADAESAARHLLAVLPDGDASARAAQARAFLDLTALAADPAKAAAAAAAIDAALKSDPGNVAALMALGAAAEYRGDLPGARAAYDKALTRYPGFVPAKKRIALVAAAGTGDDPRAFELAIQARTALPDDPEIARATGILAYRHKDYGRAENLLREAARSQGADALIQYHLGMTEARLRKMAEAKQALQRALDLGLSGDSATEARRVLAEK